MPSRTAAIAGKLRNGMTDAERKLWFRLRGGRLDGLKFRRQHPVPPYVVDFFCHEARLVVELDGSQHSPDIDAARTSALERQGLLVLRLWDNQILTDMNAVLEAILRAVQGRTLTRRCAPPRSFAARDGGFTDGRGEDQSEKST